MKLPRTIRLDSTDTRVFDPAAESGEWAVPGTFAFTELDPETLTGKARQAFLYGWLGTVSFGWATFVEVAEFPDGEIDNVAERLAHHFVERYGAPDPKAALPVAREELTYASGLCDHKVHTLLTLEREATADGIAERFRVVVPGRTQDHAKIWNIVDDTE